MSQHLTHDQLCDLLIAEPAPGLQESGRLDMLREHVRECELCSSELASLSNSLDDFRSTTTAWAAHAWTHQTSGASAVRSTPRVRVLTLPALWTAAAAMAVAVAITLSTHQNKPAPATTHTTAANSAQPAVAATQTPTIASDEALLEDIDATLSSSVPSPMQPLDDPTAGLQSMNKQRKN
jgi:hypothetical protein